MFHKSLMDCVRAGDTAVALKALNNGADPNGGGTSYNTSLYVACKNGNKAMVELLIMRGASMDGVYTLANGKPAGSPAIFGAIQHPGSEKHIECLGLLLQHKANVNITDGGKCTPLMRAAYHKKDNAGMITLLLEHKADPEVRGGQFNRSALDIANQTGNADNAILIQNAVNERRTFKSGLK